MKDSGLIEACRYTDCGWKCCSFGQDGHIVILPHEFDGNENRISHLQIIDDDYFGGKKVKCVAKDCITCDKGYKPVMCRTYPLWVKSVKKGFISRSQKCPLRNEQLTKHKYFVLDIFDKYRKATLSKTDIDDFLSKAWVDRYIPYTPITTGSLDVPIEVRPLAIKDIAEIDSLEVSLCNNDMCLKSDYEDIIRSLNSGCSYGVIVGNKIEAYSLALFTDYGTAYIDKCFVSPNHRGHGLQYKLILANLLGLASNGAREIYTMVSPKNKASIKSFTNAGFSIKREMKCHGYDRLILKWEL